MPEFPKCQVCLALPASLAVLRCRQHEHTRPRTGVISTATASAWLTTAYMICAHVTSMCGQMWLYVGGRAGPHSWENFHPAQYRRAPPIADATPLVTGLQALMIARHASNHDHAAFVLMPFIWTLLHAWRGQQACGWSHNSY